MFLFDLDEARGKDNFWLCPQTYCTSGKSYWRDPYPSRPSSIRSESSASESNIMIVLVEVAPVLTDEVIPEGTATPGAASAEVPAGESSHRTDHIGTTTRRDSNCGSTRRT